MKKNKLVLLGILLFGFGYSQINTFEVNPAAGEHFTGNNYTISWTIGEGVIETFSNNEIVLTQGFQQPRLKITLIEESDDITFQIDVFPNPTKDFLTINLLSENDISCTTALLDISGKLLLTKRFKGKELTENIDMTNYSSNMYILKITDNKGKLHRTYKIQKLE